MDAYIQLASSKLNGSTWSSPSVRDEGWVPLYPGVTHPLVDDYVGCTVGSTMRYGTRMKQNNGSWAGWSWGPGVRCY